MSRALAWVRDQTRADGAVCEPLEDPLGFLDDPEPSPRDILIAARGADVWCSALALRAHRLAGRELPVTLSWLQGLARAGQGLTWWSRRPGLCAETSAVAALAHPSLHAALVPVLRQHALPGGRWATFLLDRHGGYEEYMVGPSVTAWVCHTLTADDPLRHEGLTRLGDTRAPDGAWAGHSAFYQSSWYPTHLAAPLVDPHPALPERLRRSQLPDGGWAFDGGHTSALLPTAWALQCCVHSGMSSQDPAFTAALQRLTRAQRPNGSWPTDTLPDAVYYAGQLMTTLVVVEALLVAERATASLTPAT